MVRRCGALRVRALAGDLLCRVDAVAATGAAAEAKQVRSIFGRICSLARVAPMSWSRT